MSYRIKLGKALKMKREEIGLSQKSLSSVINKSEHFIRAVELGEDVPIDCYISYVKAVNYPLDVKRDLGIDVRKTLVKESNITKYKKSTRLIKMLIETGYFSSPRSVGEIRSKLISDYSLSELVTSGNISNVLKHLVQANNLKVDTKGKKHLYFK
ncbi:helix-turn-helix domain-containing protein [Myroides sp. LJL119]